MNFYSLDDKSTGGYEGNEKKGWKKSAILCWQCNDAEWRAKEYFRSPFEWGINLMGQIENIYHCERIHMWSVVHVNKCEYKGGMKMFKSWRAALKVGD